MGEKWAANAQGLRLGKWGTQVPEPNLAVWSIR